MGARTSAISLICGSSRVQGVRGTAISTTRSKQAAACTRTRARVEALTSTCNPGVGASGSIAEHVQVTTEDKYTSNGQEKPVGSPWQSSDSRLFRAGFATRRKGNDSRHACKDLRSEVRHVSCGGIVTRDTE